MSRNRSVERSQPACDQVLHVGFNLASRDRDERPFLNVRIGNKEFLALLDSGASRTIIGGSGWEILRESGVELCSSEYRNVVLADGKKIAVSGTFEVVLEVEDKSAQLVCLVIESIPHSIILGVDFWRAVGIVPDLTTNQFSFVPSRVECVDAVVERRGLTSDQERDLGRVVEEFMGDTDGELGCTRMVEHVIRIKPDVEPIKRRYYPVSPKVQKCIDEEIRSMLDLGVIEPSCSPWAFPIVRIRKKDGSFRFCVDYRMLNMYSIKDSYPLPYVSATLDKLRDAQFLSSLDLKSAYWQVPLQEESKQYTAFTVPGRGLFQFKRMPFGLSNAPATWQRFIDVVVGADLEPHVLVYLDDIVIVTNNFERHLEVLQEVLKRVRDAGLKLNRKKCKFCQSSLKYLGYIVDYQGLHVDPEKLEAMQKVPSPTSVKEVRSFVGAASWYRRFIPQFAELVKPLTELTKKNRRFQWTVECEDSFVKTKEAMMSAPVLSCPDFDRQFILQTDASDFGLGAVLAQQFDEGEKVIAYLSRSLSKGERNYSTTEKECLAVLWAVEKLRSYLEGSSFVVVTDHHSLVWLKNLKDPVGRLARWAIRLQQYDFEIVHRKGKDHVVPDMLSRSVPVVDVMVVSEDKWLGEMIEKVEKKPLDFPKWRVDGGRLYKDIPGRIGNQVVESWKLVLGKDQRAEVLRSCHDDPLSGHPGIRKTYAKVAAKYFWPKMKADVSRYVGKCKVCQSIKPDNRAPAGLMVSRAKNVEPWEMICVDLIGPLVRSSKGYSYILTVVDYLTKFPVLRPLRTATAQAVIRELEEHVFLAFGVPRVVVCDNGPQFRSKELKKLCESYGVELRYTAHYHPQANPAERINQIVKTTLRAYVSENHRLWDVQLGKVACCIRTMEHDVLGVTPYYANFGRKMCLRGDRDYRQVGNDTRDSADPTDRETIERRVRDLEELRKDLRFKLEAASKKLAQSYNLRRRDVQYMPQELVWRRNFALSDAANFFASKLAPKFIGPFRIKKRVSPWTYVIEDDQGKEKGTWHVKDLRAYKE